MLAGTAVGAQAPAGSGAWPQWGGPTRNFIVERAGPLAESWPESGPPVVWSRPLGTGHSAILFDEGRLYTMYRKGNGRSRQGPWASEETVVALDARTGETLWEHSYPSRREDFSFGPGPHSTPLVVGDRLFTVGTNKQLFAFDKRTGRVLWSHDLVRDFSSTELLIRPVVKSGHGCSPIAFRDTIICSVGGPGQSVMAFRQSDGAVVWRSGDFLTSEAPPILIDVDGSPQVVFLAGGTVTALDPVDGRILWSHPHDPGNDLNCSTPLWGPDNILFVSSAYQAGSRAIRLRTVNGVTVPEELWFTSRVRFMFLNAVRVGDFIYGTTGDFGPAFLTALDVRTGRAAWQHRGFGRASLIYADGKLVVMDEDGDLALARVSPEGVTILAEAKVFDTTSWTVPTLVGTRLYARDREKIVALELGAADADASTPQRPASAAAPVNVRVQPAAVAARAAGPTPAAPLAGTWKLDASKSRIHPAAGLAGLIGAGVPPMLHITQPADGAVVVESPINQGHVRIYRPDARTETPAGQGGSVTMTSRWSDGRLVSEGSITTPAGVTTRVSEVYAVGSAPATLTIEISTEGSERATSQAIYSRISDVGPCDSWPTPCKRAP